MLLFYLCFAAAFFSKAYGEITFEDSVTPELVTSARARAMGNAFISKVDDSASAFYNPAGLGTVRKTHFHLSNFHIEGSKGWLEAGLGGQAFKAIGNFTKALEVDGLRELLVEKPGVTSYNRLQFMPNFTTRYFSVGYMYSKQTKATVTRNAADPTLDLFEYATRRDHGPYAALNLSLWGGILKIGFTGTFLQRKEASGDVDPDVAITLEDSDYKKGAAFNGTSGVKLTLPFKLLPTFSLVSHNTFENDFSGSNTPDAIVRTTDIGFSITPQIAQTTRVHFEINYKDFEGAVAGVSERRRLAIGMEIDVARTFFMRLGYGDGFGSGGVGIRSQRFEVDFSTYAVDTTANSFRGKEDRRFAMSFSSGF